MNAMATERATATGTVVVGPRTRLGAALLARPAAGSVYAVARHDEDRAALSATDATVISTHGTGPLLGDERPEQLRIHVCALGPLHAETAHPDDAAFVARDLELIARLLGEAEGRETHVVLVSTILALAPTPDRAYYAGWKNVVEEELFRLVDATPGARLSVLYPGRLLAASERRKPWHRTHTTFEKLAALMDDVSEGPARSRIVGLDARIWLMTRSASLVVTSLSGSRGNSRRRGVVGSTDIERHGNR